MGTETKASITYSNEDGGTEQRDVPLPWEHTMTLGYFDHAYISAQKEHKSAVTITCQIIVDGEVWKEATSNAAYGIASCNGLVGTDN